jgi:hypothetical protein
VSGLAPQRTLGPSAGGDVKGAGLLSRALEHSLQVLRIVNTASRDAVGQAKGRYPLTGNYDDTQDMESVALAFCVTWKNDTSNSRAATSWVGQLQSDGRKDKISTTWILLVETQSDDDWESTRVGQDVYRRSP